MTTKTSAERRRERREIAGAEWMKLRARHQEIVQNGCDVVELYNHCHRMMTFLHNDKTGLRDKYEPEYRGFETYIQQHEAEVEAIERRKAWESLADRLDARAKRLFEEGIKQRLDSVVDSYTRGFRVTNSLESMDYAFKDAADLDVAREIAAHVRKAYTDGVEPDQGFAYVRKHIDDECKRRGRSSRWSSTSVTNNLSEEVQRLAWFRIQEDIMRFEYGWKL